MRFFCFEILNNSCPGEIWRELKESFYYSAGLRLCAVHPLWAHFGSHCLTGLVHYFVRLNVCVFDTKIPVDLDLNNYLIGEHLTYSFVKKNSPTTVSPLGI